MRFVSTLFLMGFLASCQTTECPEVECPECPPVECKCNLEDIFKNLCECYNDEETV